ncbi:UBX domain-containing protein 2B [Discoglossus pictus]
MEREGRESGTEEGEEMGDVQTEEDGEKGESMEGDGEENGKAGIDRKEQGESKEGDDEERSDSGVEEYEEKGKLGEEEGAGGVEEEAESQEEDRDLSEDNREETGKEEDRQALQRPSVLDIQLALARLCEDKYGDQPSDFDMPMLESDPEQQFERSYLDDARLNTIGEIVHELFKEAKEHGAIPVEEASKATEEFYKVKSFAGGGYKLGDSSKKPSEYIRGDEQFERGHDIQVLLKLWSNGFSLDDGELRSYRDPVNAEFLESIKRGEIPAELQRLVHGGQVNLDMEDHQDQEYVKPRLKFKAFSGEGQKLGSVTPEIISTPSSPEEEHKIFSFPEIDLDEHWPTTKIQIRLADGSRLIQRFNLTHRIIDIRQFILLCRPEFAQSDFVLVTTFPSIEITDESQTLEEADIVNTVLLQRLK